MKKVKQINLLQTKERLQQQKTISHLVQIQSETEKCIKLGCEKLDGSGEHMNR